jgi:hypothetical protein
MRSWVADLLHAQALWPLAGDFRELGTFWNDLSYLLLVVVALDPGLAGLALRSPLSSLTISKYSGRLA